MDNFFITTFNKKLFDDYAHQFIKTYIDKFKFKLVKLIKFYIPYEIYNNP